jgi:predicted transcriptional regulator
MLTVDPDSVGAIRPQPVRRPEPDDVTDYDGLLTCRECGKRRRNIAAHAHRVHGLSAEQYRTKFRLPAGTRLVATGSYPRSAARAVRTAGLAAGNRQRAAAVRAELDQRAKACGYRDLETLIRATAHLRIAEVSALLGKTGNWATHWSRAFGVDKQAREQARAQRRTDPAGHLGLGEQPAHADGRLLCRLCGTWQQQLPRHMRDAHGLTPEQYRNRFAIAPTTRLDDTPPSPPPRAAAAQRAAAPPSPQANRAARPRRTTGGAR